MEKRGLKLNNKGFSLLELVIAIAIISVGIVFVIQALGFSAKGSALHSDYLRASLLAEDAIQNLELRQAQQLIGEEISQDKNGKFDSSMVIGFDDTLNLYKMDLKISWLASKKTEELKLSTYYRK